jgi:hypothetical protein
VSALALAGQARAAEPGAHVIIIAGGADAAPATSAVARLAKSGLGKRLELSAGFPRVVESSSVAGLKPGFHIAIAGFCPTKGKQAAIARDVLALEFPGTYLRTVTGESDTQCPKVLPAPCESRSRKYLEVETEKYHPSTPSLSWRNARVNMDGRTPRHRDFDSLFIDLIQGGQCLASRKFSGEMEDPRWEFLMEWSVGKQVQLPGRSFLVLRNGGGSASSLLILGWACGTLSDLLTLDAFDPNDLSIEPAAEKGELPTFEIGGVKEAGTYILDECKLVRRKPAKMQGGAESK